jgi:UDP-glucose 4-epimerase
VKVLVTGARGFTGRALLGALLDRGDTVYAIHRPDGSVPAQLDGAEAIAQDLTAPLDSSLPRELDAVVHLAQSRRFREFPEGAADVFEVNAGATVRLLEWARTAGARSFVFASSGAVYLPGPKPVSEEQVAASLPNFYATSKRAGELACEAFRTQLRTQVLRFFFIYGPGQEAMFVPGILERIRSGREVDLAGEQGIRVNPVYVDDAVVAILGALEAPQSMTLNVGGPDVVSLREIAELAGGLLGRQPRYAVGDPRPDVLASIDRLREAGLGPRIAFADGLRRTVAA